MHAKKTIDIGGIPLPVDDKPARTDRKGRARLKAAKKQQSKQQQQHHSRLKPTEVTNRQKVIFGTMVANSKAKRGMSPA